ncbi:LysR substrate-binding domain-containing protein [Embleya sp. NPDC127516]|uniref:LysR substrate-binding domain-containing protein n=1 Tax=Embleya sp. NPDC127516 TaxID=3363990 RepID=UPI00381F305E
MPADHRLAERDRVTLVDLADLADLADEPVVCPDMFTSPEAERHRIVDPRPDGTPAPRSPRVAQIEECLRMVAPGRGIWPAPEPLAHSVPAMNIRWVPISDAEPVELAVVWTDRGPEELIATMVAEVPALVTEPTHAMFRASRSNSPRH